MTDLDSQAALSDIRTRVLAGERISAAEYRQMLDDLRRGRDSAAQRAKPAARQRSQRQEVSLDALFGSDQ